MMTYLVFAITCTFSFQLFYV